jgi:hypothetical protein
MDLTSTLPMFVVRNQMSNFSKTYSRTRKKKRVDETEVDPDPIQLTGATSGPSLKPRAPRRVVGTSVGEIEEEGIETSSEDDQESDENYRMEFRKGKGPAADDDDDDDDEDEEEDYGGRGREEEGEEEDG